MSSFRRLISSRANAALSTGPRTEAGKRRSSQNAFRHGCRSRRNVIPENESRQEFDNLLPEFLSCFRPRNPPELAFVQQMAASCWRLGLLRAIEFRKWNEAFAAQSLDSHHTNIGRITAAFESLVNVPGFAILFRYEATQDLNFHRAFQKLQALRKPTNILQKPAVLLPDSTVILRQTQPEKARVGAQPGNQQRSCTIEATLDSLYVSAPSPRIPPRLHPPASPIPPAAPLDRQQPWAHPRLNSNPQPEGCRRLA